MTQGEVAEHTLRTLRRCVPAAVPGIAFLSGGLSEERATQYLNSINALSTTGPHAAPWALTFSYGRALQQSCLQAWKGLEENISVAQRALLARAKANAAASVGGYVGDSQPSAPASLFEPAYRY